VSDARRWCLALLILVAACRSRDDAASARLESITLSPQEARRSVGQPQRFTATGHYAGGATRNLTQHVEYHSSDPAIARPANATGDRSRVDALAPGTVTITATDPRTGVRSQAAGGDATLVVLGALERITLAPVAVRRAIGDAQRLTATGHYAGGTTRNHTQHVEYRSSDPAVVVAANAAGDKSRLDPIGAGRATVSAVDPESGITSTASGADVTVTVEAARHP
jgi:uncharacterized protein YjdB